MAGGLILRRTQHDRNVGFMDRIRCDADTFRVDIDGWPDVVSKRVPVRVKGVDAPEIRG